MSKSEGNVPPPPPDPYVKQAAPPVLPQVPRQQIDHFWTSRNWSEGRPLALAAHRIDILRTSVDPKMVQILTVLSKPYQKVIFSKVLDNHLYTQKA